VVQTLISGVSIPSLRERMPPICYVVIAHFGIRFLDPATLLPSHTAHTVGLDSPAGQLGRL
jgi:hypothetical protein